MDKILKIIRSFIPPVLNDFITSRKWSFTGNYHSFEEASKNSKGYSDKETVAEMKKNSLRAIKQNQAKRLCLILMISRSYRLSLSLRVY